ncbi:hypothetical protein P3L10_018873 [Capsicum annuum]
MNERKCSNNMKTGQCKYGITCKFHHPLPAGVQVPTSVAGSFPFSNWGTFSFASGCSLTSLLSSTAISFCSFN